MKIYYFRKNRLLRLSFVLSLLLFAANLSYAQSTMMSGTVVDEKDEPLIGATIQVKGSAKGVATTPQGRFTLPLSKDDIIIVSSLGLTTQEVKVGNNKSLYIKMLPSAQSISEVVVTGYGNIQKRDITGSMAKVDMGDISKAPVASIGDALGGRIAGVVVSSADGQPGMSSVITIRGNNSLTGGNTPLYVIDGFPLEDPNMNSIPPEDIESIEVLKDASSTAIYGARGANGVIIITTKKGQVGKPVISYDGSYGIQKVTKQIPVMSPYDFVKMFAEYNPRDAERYFTNGRTLENYRGLKGLNFQDEIFRTAPMQSHNLALRGGNESTRYSVSLNYLDQQGIIINGGFNRLQGKIVLDQNINKFLKVGINTSYSKTKQYGVTPSTNQYTSSAYIMSDVWGYRPINYDGTTDELLGMDKDPDAATIDWTFNPVTHAKNVINERVAQSLDARAYLEFTISKDLKLRVSGGLNNYSMEQTDFNNSKTKYGNRDRTEKVNGQVVNRINNSWLNENILTYNKRFKKSHKLNAIVGMTFQGAKSKVNGARAVNVPNESLGVAGLDLGTPQRIDASSSAWTLASFLTRVNYDYKSKYLFTASFRADGSSKFSQGNKWSYFPSGAFAWRAVDENFIKNNANFISDLKLRVSWGITGNNRIGDFASLAQINGTYYFNGAGYSAVVPTSLNNKTLRWENTAQTNIGVDFGVFDQRLTLTFDAYKKRTYDLLLDSRIAGSTGYVKAMKNVGEVENSGLEFTLNTVNIATKKFRWTTNFNIAFNRNKVIKLAEGDHSYTSPVPFDQNYKNVPAYIAIVGQPISQMMGLVYDGLYQESDFDRTPSGAYILKETVACNTASRANAVAPGHLKYKDLNGDGIINSDDYTTIGNPIPKHTGGFSNTFTYRDFDLNLFFQWSYGNDIYNTNRLIYESSNSVYQNSNKFATFANRWSPENTGATIPVAGGTPQVYNYVSNIVEDGSFLRLKTVALGYTFPNKLTGKIGISRLRLNVSAQNLYTWTNYTGYDPEVSSRHSALTPGFDFSTYPRAFTVTFGLNATF